MKNLKKIIFFTLLLTAGWALGEENESFQFANLSWGIEEEEVIQGLSQNYSFSQKTDDGDLMFTGTLAGESIVLIAYMSDNKLARIIVALSPDRNELLQTFGKFKSLLADRYGSPFQDDEIYNSPYEKGDGYEEQAIENSKGVLGSKWSKKQDGSSLSMISSKSLSILLFYDTSEGESEEARRSAESASDL